MRERIAAAGGDPGGITVVAVTKGFGVDAPLAALHAGLTEIGENYADELVAKAAAVRAAGGGSASGSAASGDGADQDGADGEMVPHWHYLGAVQRNKVARLAPHVSCWQTVARASEATAIAARCEPGPRVFIEIDLSGLSGRRGCSLAEAPAVVEAARSAGCVVRGLMTVAPLADVTGSQAALAADAFGKVARLASVLGLNELSMGMSHDLEQAVAAGSTMVRIGTALFGERAAK